jgi:hypothetical protein
MTIDPITEVTTVTEQQPQEPPFIKVPRATKFSASAPWAAVPGDKTWKKLDNVNKHFENHPAYAGAKQYNLRKTRERVISIYFTSETDMENAIKEPITTLNNLKFIVFYAHEKELEIQQQRDKEKSRTIKISDLPLDIKSHTIKSIFSHFGTIERVGMGLSGKWQHAYIVYTNADSITEFYDNTWSIPILGNHARVTPLNLTDDQQKLRNHFCLKLTGFPRGTTSRDLEYVLHDTKAKTCVIPRDRNHDPINIAFLTFSSEEDLVKASTTKPYKFQGRELFWSPPELNTCFHCGHPDHASNNCKFQTNANRNKSQKFDRLYKRFMPEAYNPPINRSFSSGSQPSTYANAVKDRPPTNNNTYTEDPQLYKILLGLQKHIEIINEKIADMDGMIKAHDLRIERLENHILNTELDTNTNVNTSDDPFKSADASNAINESPSYSATTKASMGWDNDENSSMQTDLHLQQQSIRSEQQQINRTLNELLNHVKPTSSDDMAPSSRK